MVSDSRLIHTVFTCYLLLIWVSHLRKPSPIKVFFSKSQRQKAFLRQEYVTDISLLIKISWPKTSKLVYGLWNFRGEALELRPLLGTTTDSILVCGDDVLSISVETTGHTLYLSRLLSAQPLSISVLSELCLHLASIKLLHREHVALLAIVRKNLSRGIAVAKPGQYWRRSYSTLGLCSVDCFGTVWLSFI